MTPLPAEQRRAVGQLGTAAREAMTELYGVIGALREPQCTVDIGALVTQFRDAGVAVTVDPERVRRIIGYMPDNNPLPEDMRVSEYMYFRGRLKALQPCAPRLCDANRPTETEVPRLQIVGAQ